VLLCALPSRRVPCLPLLGRDVVCRTVDHVGGPTAHRLDPLWGELPTPAAQARIVRALVYRVAVALDGADIRLRVEGLAGLVRDLVPVSADGLGIAA
jgi:hypothetical protein